ncbi:MAG: hypothetical protein WCK39_09860 [Methanomassiliicoccales archaeon]
MKGKEFQDAAKAVANVPEDEMQEYLNRRLMEGGGPIMVMTATLFMISQGDEFVSFREIRSLAHDMAERLHEGSDFSSTAAAAILILLDAHERRLASDPEYVKFTEYVKKVLAQELGPGMVLGAKGTEGPMDPMFR